MIGFYDYTMLLTYISLVSAGTGIIASLSGDGHPYIGTFFLMLSGLCDAFDGKVARTKQDRTDMERAFGIQIDSLSDLVAFGVLPACIGAAMIRCSPFLSSVFEAEDLWFLAIILKFILVAVLILYILAAMIRLAFYNVTEEERQKTESGNRKYFLGVPVTSATLVFPTILLVQYLTPFDITLVYFLFIVITGGAFLTKIHVRKPTTKGVLGMIAFCLIELIILTFFYFYFKR